MSVRVAPREITDYVERAARVGGCDPSDAQLLAAAVTYAEIHGGGGIVAFLRASDAMALAAAIRSLDAAAVGLLDRVDTDAAEHVLADQVAKELLTMSLDGWCRLGITADLATTGLVERVVVRRVDQAGRSDARRHEYRRALAEGVEIARHDWERLTAAAADFTVAESVLDAR